MGIDVWRDMALYPEGNPGVFPLDPETPVGQFRVLYGDVYSTPYDPVEPGFQNYEELSDAEISGFLAQGNDSVKRAIGYYYLSLSGTAAKEAKSVKDYDLSVDLTKRAADLRATAQVWFDHANADDDASQEDAFEIVPTGLTTGEWIPEGAIGEWGRRYTLGRWR
jgi:hypothetical protein